jgi:hypothetical protein
MGEYGAVNVVCIVLRTWWLLCYGLFYYSREIQRIEIYTPTELKFGDNIWGLYALYRT